MTSGPGDGGKVRYQEWKHLSCTGPHKVALTRTPQLETTQGKVTFSLFHFRNAKMEKSGGALLCAQTIPK